MEGTNGVTPPPPGGGGGGVRSPPPLSSGSPITTPSPRLELPRNKKAINNQRTMDEMRAHIAKLKNELESEKARYKQLHRDKVSEIRQTKEGCERDREYALQQLGVKLDQEKLHELNRQREQLSKEKDTELRQLLKQKEEDVRHAKSQAAQEKENGIKVALEMQKKALTEQREFCLSPNGSMSSSGMSGAPGATPPTGTASNSALIVRFQREIKQLKDSKKETEEQLKMRTAADNEKTTELRRIRRQHQAEMAKLVKEYKQDGQRDMQMLRRAEELASGRASSSLSQDERLGSAGSSSGRHRTRTESSGSTTPVSRQESGSAAGTDAEDEVS